MMRTMLKSKIHRATITEADLHYKGSITIARELMEAADILPYEMVRIYNISNGERFETYAIEGKAGSGMICLNGAAARKGAPGDLIIIATYALMDTKDLVRFTPKLIQVDAGNRLPATRKKTSRK
jgi:aspartate 1-decarboxylase